MFVRQIFSSAFFRVLNLFASVSIAFVMTPFIIGRLGDETYGLWLFASAVFGFYGMLDFGLSVATQRSIAQSLAKDDVDSANAAVVTSFVMFCGIGVLALVITVLVSIFGDALLGNAERLDEFRIVVLLLGTSVALQFPTYAVVGIYSANFRYDITARIHLLKLVLRTIAIYLFVLNGYGVVSMAVATLATDIMAGLATVAFSYRLAPWLRWGPSFYRPERLRELVSFGGAFLFVGLCERARNALPSFAVNSTSGLAELTVFGVARQVYDYFGTFLSNIFGVFQPLFVRQQSVQQHEANERDFQFLTQLALSIAVVMAVAVVACAPDFITTWLGSRFRESLGPLFILVVGGVFHTSLQTNVQVLLAYSKQKALAIVSACELGVSAALLWPMASSFGLEGVATAMLLPAVMSRMIVQPMLIRREMGVDLTRYYLTIVRCVSFLVACGWLVSHGRQIVPGSGYPKVLLIGFVTVSLAVPLAFAVCLDGPTRARVVSTARNALMRRGS